MLHQLSPFEVGYIDRRPNKLFIGLAVFFLAAIIALPLAWWLGYDSLKNGVSSDAQFYLHLNVGPKTRPLVIAFLKNNQLALPADLKSLSVFAIEANGSLSWFIISRQPLGESSSRAGKYFYTGLGPSNPEGLKDLFLALNQRGSLARQSVKPWFWAYQGDYGFASGSLAKAAGLDEHGFLRNAFYFKLAFGPEQVLVRAVPQNWSARDLLRIWSGTTFDSAFLTLPASVAADDIHELYLTAQAKTFNALFEQVSGSPIEKFSALSEDRNWANLQDWLGQASGQVVYYGDHWLLKASSSRPLSQDSLFAALRALLAESWPTIKSSSLADGTALRELVADRDHYQWESVPGSDSEYKLSVPVLDQTVFLARNDRSFWLTNDESAAGSAIKDQGRLAPDLFKCAGGLRHVNQAYFSRSPYRDSLITLKDAIFVDKSGYVDICFSAGVDK